MYTLGPLGTVVYPTAFNDPNRPDARPPRSSVERTERIIGSRKLAHLLGTNQLFIDLIGYARTDPHAGLVRWWSEQHSTAVYARAGIRPDGHGVWTAGRSGGRILPRARQRHRAATHRTEEIARLPAAGRVRARYPVLLRVPGRRREQQLLDALAGVSTAMPVATGIHGEHTAGPTWTLTADPGRRRWLHELPSDHGPDNPATNPHRFPDEGPIDVGCATNC